MENCIFCKIGRGEISHNRIYEDKDFVAFLDANPVEKGHVLIIPKKHSIWMQEADDEIISGIFKLAKKIMLSMKTGLGCDYVQVSVVGKDVPHFHVHLIPRHFSDNLHQSSIKKYEDGEEKEIMQKIISAL